MFGLAVRKVVLSMLTKLRRDSTLENDEIATSVQDSSLLPHRKWHEVCWRLPFDSLQWSRWPNVSPCESGEENPTLYSQ